MALLLSLILTVSPNHSLSLRRTQPLNYSSSSAIRISMSVARAVENTKTGGTADLWFKHDLRIDDHPGLLAASRLRTLMVHEKLRNAEIRQGASFGALFGSVLWLGIISRRRVYYETIKYEKEWNAGFLSLFGYSAATVAAAVDTVCSIELASINYDLLIKCAKESVEASKLTNK